MEIKLDLSYLENMSAGDNNLIKEMIEIFKEQVPEFIAEMNNSIKNNDSKALASIAHKAKSSVAIMGITNLAEELKVLENIASNNERSNEYPVFVDSFITTVNEAVLLLNNISHKL
jgi:HPt (histidine-containing phosphotransfer) domain-containing protein